MANTVFASEPLRGEANVSRSALLLALMVSAWFVIALSLGANNFFMTTEGPPLALLLAVTSPA